MSVVGKAVFLSYASQDTEAAKRICDTLRSAGVEVWFDQNELVGGDAWDAKIRKQIAECALFVPIISANTQARDEGYFRLEWKLAADRTHLMAHDKAFLLPVVIDATSDAAARVPPEFTKVQWTRLRQAYGGPAREGGEARDEALGAFSARVQKLLGGAALEAGRPEGAVDLARGARPAMRGEGTPPPRQAPRQWLAPALAVVGAVVALVIWQSGRPGKKTEPSIEGTPQAVTKPIVPRSGPSPAVASLIARARALTAKTDIVRPDLETSANLLLEAARLEPTYLGVWAELALVDCRYWEKYLDRSEARRASALGHAAKAASLDGEDPLARFAQAVVMTLGQKNESASTRALQIAEPLVDRLADRPDVLYFLGGLQAGRGNLEQSLAYLDRAAAMPGQLGRANIDRCWAYFINGRMKEADEAVDRALAAEASAYAKQIKAFILIIWHGDTAAAPRLFADIPPEILLEDYAASARFFSELWCGNPDQALAAMQAVPRDFVESQALYGPTGFYRGLAHARAGRRAAAELEWRAALALVQRELTTRPNDDRLLTFLGLLQSELGERASALKTWQSIRELNGDQFVSWPNYFLQMTVLPEEEALTRLEMNSAAGRAVGLAGNLRLDPFLERLRQHPRFQALLAKAEADPRRSPRAGSEQGPGSKLAAPSDPKSIAVLAFANLSDDKANEYFSDGISEELLNVLAKVPGLKVSARTSAFHFKGQNLPIPEIAQKLGVAYVVEGSVQRAGERVKITAQLIKAADGFHLWSDTFTRDAKDVFAVEEEIAGLIAKQLSLKLGVSSAAAKAAVKPEAFALYVQARQAWNLRTGPGFERAERLLNQALALEPNFVHAHAALADVWLNRGSQDFGFRLGNFSQRESPELERIGAKIRQTLALDPESAEAHAALGHARWLAWDFAAAEHELRRAVALNPNYASAHQWLGRVFDSSGKMDEALAELKLAVTLDPLSPIILNNYGVRLQNVGREAEALAVFERAIVLNPDSRGSFGHKAEVLFDLGRVKEAHDFVRSLPEADAATRYTKLRTLAYVGLRDEANALLARRGTQPGTYGPELLLLLGRTEEALATLNPATVSVVRVANFYYERIYDSIRADPRFVRFLATLGLTEAHARAQVWRKANPPEKAK